MFTVRQTEEFGRWLKGLKDRRAAARIALRIDRIAGGNFGDHKALKKGVWEARIDYGPGYRLYFVRREKTLVLLLCGGDKSTQKRDIEHALYLVEKLI